MLRELLQGYNPTRLATAPYPEAQETIPALVRRRPALTRALCNGDGACVRACPTTAIQADPWQIDLGKCLFCGACAEACPSQAITLTQEYELAARKREDLIVDGNGQPVGAGAPEPTMGSSALRRAWPMTTIWPQ